MPVARVFAETGKLSLLAALALLDLGQAPCATCCDLCGGAVTNLLAHIALNARPCGGTMMSAEGYTGVGYVPDLTVNGPPICGSLGPGPAFLYCLACRVRDRECHRPHGVFICLFHFVAYTSTSSMAC